MNYIALAAGTLFIIVFSWLLSVRHQRYHGIPRFFAFESVFVLFLLNVKVWFTNPFSIFQIISWIFLIFSAYIAVDGYLTLKRRGKPDRNFENTSLLVRTGVYKFIRHPLYFSIFLLGTGIMLKDTGTIQLLLGATNTVAIWFTARIEEREMMKKFGAEYKDYMKETRMFIPFIL